MRHRTAVLLAAVTLVVVCVAGCGPHSGPASPQAAAQAWGDALVRHDAVAERKLSCAAGTQAEALLGMTAGAVTGYTAGHATKEGDGAWSVELEAEEARGPGVSIEIHVIREDGEYVVC
ncbi:MAG TPA: hypothetical protein VGC32_13580 [Solirubrobacterales bacterium]